MICLRNSGSIVHPIALLAQPLSFDSLFDCTSSYYYGVWLSAFAVKFVRRSTRVTGARVEEFSLPIGFVILLFFRSPHDAIMSGFLLP